MGAWVDLLFGVSAFITALVTGTTGVVGLVRGSSKERERAAQGALDRIVDDNDDAAINSLIDELKRLRDERKRHDG
jgi:hypothetical protein